MALRNQPAYIIRMRAKPGLGDKLFELAAAGMVKSGASDQFIMARENDDPDVLWNMEVFRSEEAKADYENSPLADELRDEIIELLAEPHRSPPLCGASERVVNLRKGVCRATALR